MMGCQLRKNWTVLHNKMVRYLRNIWEEEGGWSAHEGRAEKMWVTIWLRFIVYLRETVSCNGDFYVFLWWDVQNEQPHSSPRWNLQWVVHSSSLRLALWGVYAGRAFRERALNNGPRRHTAAETRKPEGRRQWMCLLPLWKIETCNVRSKEKCIAELTMKHQCSGWSVC